MIRRKMRASATVAAVAFAMLTLAAQQAAACAVCFGDPDSDMSKAAVWGVATLFGIVGSVLTGIAGVGLFWHQRSRRMAQLDPDFITGDTD